MTMSPQLRPESSVNPLMTPNIQAALHFARQAHEGQERAYTGEAYINHPIQVATIVSNVGASEAVIMAALLHDTVEDCEHVTHTLLKRFFGYEVAQLVRWLTDEDPGENLNRSSRKAQNNERLRRAPAAAQTVKLADILSNTKDIVATAPELAPIYLPEKKTQLEVLTKGNFFLQNMAASQIEEELAKLNGGGDEAAT